jgi:hypothetical protein
MLFLFQPYDGGIEIGPGLFDHQGLAEFGENKQQNNGPEGAADAVQEGETEDFDIAAARAHDQGQSGEGQK